MKTRFNLTAQVRLKAAANGKPHRLMIVGYTGVPMRLAGQSHLTVLDLAGMVAKPVLPVLADHENLVSAVVGSGVPSTDGKTLVVAATVADTAAGRSVVSILASGSPLQASIGGESMEGRPIGPDETVTVNGRSLTGPFRLVDKWELKEMTVTPLGADDQTSTTLAARRRVKGSAMTFEDWLTSLGFDPATISEEVSAALRKAFDAEHGEAPAEEVPEEVPTNAAARRPTIAASTEVVLILARNGESEHADRAVRERWSPARATRFCLEQLRASRPVGPPTHHGPIGGGSVSPKKTVEAAALIKAGFEAAAVKAYGEQVAESARPLARRGMLDIAAASLRAAGKSVPHDRDDMIRASMSGGDLSVALGNTANKIAETVWRTAEPTWRSFCAIRSAANFKTHTSIRPSFAGNLAPTGPGGEIDHGTTSEETFEWKVYQFAKKYTIAREDIVNDDVNVLSELVPGLTKAAALTLSNLIYFTLLNNKATQFTTGRGNKLSGGGSVLSAAALRTIVMQFRNMLDPAGNCISLAPAVLAVPPALEELGRELLQAAEVLRDQTADRQPTGNIYQGLARLEVEPRLGQGCRNPYDNTFAAGSDTGWFMFASPADMPMLVGFLNGREAPNVETFNFSADPNRLAMTWRIVHDFGAALGDYRAGQWAVGA